MSRTYWNTVHGRPFVLPMPHERQAFWPAYTLNGLGALPSWFAFNPQPDPPKVYTQRFALRGLGATYSIGTPVGKVNISVPVEQIAADAAGAAVDAAWPAIQQKINAELPLLVKKALDQAQPRIRAEADRAIDAGTSRAAMIATGVVVVVIGAAWWTRRAITKGR